MFLRWLFFYSHEWTWEAYRADRAAQKNVKVEKRR